MTLVVDKVYRPPRGSCVDSDIRRLSSLSDSTGTLAADTYLGLDTVVRQAYPQPGVELTDIKQAGESNGDAGDKGRIERSGGGSSMLVAYDEFVDFIAGGSTPQPVIDFCPSEETKAKVADLSRRQKTESLSPDQTAELNQYLQIEHLMRSCRGVPLKQRPRQVSCIVRPHT